MNYVDGLFGYVMGYAVVLDIIVKAKKNGYTYYWVSTWVNEWRTNKIKEALCSKKKYKDLT